MIIAFAGYKGGSGKSIVCINVAVEFQRRGKKVLLVDADPQGTAQTWCEVASREGLTPPTVVALGAGLAHPAQLPTLAADFDVTLIDCPGNDSDVQRAALIAADLIILPATPNTIDLWTLASSVQLVTRARELKPELKAAVLINRKANGTSVGDRFRDAIKECGLPILKTELGRRVIFAEALALGLGVTQGAPSSPASLEMKALVDEIEKYLKHLKVDDEKTKIIRNALPVEVIREFVQTKSLVDDRLHRGIIQIKSATEHPSLPAGAWTLKQKPTSSTSSRPNFRI